MNQSSTAQRQSPSTRDIRQTFLGGNEKVGGFLKKSVFEPGARYEWNDMIEKATGEKLTPSHYCDQFIEK